MIRIYGIKQCSTMQKAFSWLEAQGLAYTFHDYKKLGIDTATLEEWERTVGWEALLNTRGTTWRKLDEADREGVNREKALSLMQAHTSLIRRPVVATGKALLIGFDEQRFTAALKEVS